MTFDDKQKLLITFLNYMYHIDFRSTISTLSQVTHTSLQQTRKLVEQILTSEEFCMKFQMEMNIEVEEDTEKAFALKIAKGDYDDIPISFANADPLNRYKGDEFFNKEYPFAMNKIELDLLHSSFPGLFQKSNTHYHFLIKGMDHAVSQTVLDRKDLLEQYIQDGGISCMFKYQGRTKKLHNVRCIPVSVTHNLSENYFYLNDSKNNAYRLDRIMGDITPTPKPLSRKKAGAKESPSVIPVKVKIINPTNNLLTKIQNDTRLRGDSSKLYHNDGFYYYEDEINSQGDFLQWVRQYGKSMLILEPRSLAEDVYQNAKEKLKRYEILDNFSPKG